MRDAISLLELCAGTRQKITPALVDETVGSGGREALEQVVRAIAASNFDGIFSAIDGVVRSSRDVAVFWQDLQSFYRDMLVMRTTSAADRYLDLTEGEAVRLKKVSELFPKETLLHHCRIMDEAFYAMQKAGAAKRMVAEMALLRMCDTSLDASPDAILSRIAKLETAVAAGVTFRPVSEPTAKEEARSEQEPLIQEAAVDTQEPKAKEPDAQPEQAMKLIRGWNEIAEQASAGDSAVSAFVKMAKALMAADGKVHLKFPNDFAKSMVDKPATREAIRAALCMALGRTLSENDLVLGVMEADEAYTDLDEFEL